VESYTHTHTHTPTQDATTCNLTPVGLLILDVIWTHILFHKHCAYLHYANTRSRQNTVVWKSTTKYRKIVIDTTCLQVYSPTTDAIQTVSSVAGLSVCLSVYTSAAEVTRIYNIVVQPSEFYF